MKHKINHEECVMCMLCAEMNPDAFVLHGGKIAVFSQELVDKGTVESCPMGAIEEDNP